MDHAGVFQSSSFMAPDTLAVTIQTVAFALALVSTYRLLLRFRHTTNLVIHRVTILAMLFCSVFAWLTFGYLFFRHELETCIVRVWSATGRSSPRARILTSCFLSRFACSIGRAGPAWYSTSSARPSSTPSLSRKPSSQTSSCTGYGLVAFRRLASSLSNHGALLLLYQGPRLGNPLFRKLAAMWCVYGVLFVLLCFNAIAEYTPPRTANGTLPEPGGLGNGTFPETRGMANATLLDGFCTFYVKPPASIPIVVYDLIFTSTLVYYFVAPLIEGQKNGPKGSDSKFHDLLRKTTRKALIGARITLLASFLNFMSLVLFPMVRHFGLRVGHAAVLCALFCYVLR